MSTATPDKNYLYGRYQAAEDSALGLFNSSAKWREQLAMKQAHKALDIPIETAAEDMQISSNTTHNHGIGKLPALLLGAGLMAAGAGIPAAALLANNWFARDGAQREIERIIEKESGVTVGPITVREE